MKFCTKCGTQCTDMMQFCSVCGHALNATDNQTNMVTGNSVDFTPNTPAVTKKNYKLWRMLGGAIALIAIIVAIVLSQNKNSVYGIWYLPEVGNYMEIEEDLVTMRNGSKEESMSAIVSESSIIFENGEVWTYVVNGDELKLTQEGIGSTVGIRSE